MTDDSNLPADARTGRSGLADQMQRLQAYVADAHARGEEVPPEADMMIKRLEELVGAIDDLMKEGTRDRGNEGT